MLRNEIKNNLMYWYCGLMFIGSGIALMIVSNDVEIITKMAEKLTYDKLLYLFGILIMWLGIQYLSTPLSPILAKLLWRSERIRTWYINSQNKKRDKNAR